MKIIHSWHEDMGWRKNIALNSAVKRATGDYLIFIDGDCIPHRDFVKDHFELAKRGRVVAGRRIDLPRKISDEIAKMATLPRNYDSLFRCWILRGLFTSTTESAKILKRLIHLNVKNGRIPGMKPGGILGCNFSLFRDDFLSINGFDERYLNPGTGEDTDIDLRLTNNRIKAMKVSRAAMMYHRHHNRLPMDSIENHNILEENRNNCAKWVESGINI